MSFADDLAADRRLVMLRALTEVPAYALNETVLKAALHHFGHRVGHDMVRADLDYLARHGLLAVEKVSKQTGDIWVATLTAFGDDVARGMSTHVGVARRGVD